MCAIQTEVPKFSDTVTLPEKERDSSFSRYVYTYLLLSVYLPVTLVSFLKASISFRASKENMTGVI